MRFIVVSAPGAIPENRRPGDCYLSLGTSWNDWFKYRTAYTVTLVLDGGKLLTVGQVKIGCEGMDTTKHHAGVHGYSSPPLLAEFAGLPDGFFSLGQSEAYYESLSLAGDSIREELLQALKDLARQPDLLDRFRALDVFQDSVARNIREDTIRGKFHELAMGRATLTPFHFRFTCATDGRFTPYEIEVRVSPSSFPPTNLHAIIGRNGVGKTHCLRTMAASAVAPGDNQDAFVDLDSGTVASFRKVVSVSFSAFDPFLPVQTPPDGVVEHHYIGLKPPPGSVTPFGLDSDAQAESLAQAIELCRQGVRRERFRRALGALNSDPIFAASGAADLLAGDETPDDIGGFFRRLSSGHKIILLTLTRLVAATEERTLILMDEPEAHLHPPLLSAFLRGLSDLLIDRNAVAIVATHSPVVLQEVPSTCVNMLHRDDRDIAVFKPEFETFGESIGRLTSEVFGHEVTDSGFHRVLREVVSNNKTYDAALAKFGGQLGGMAKGLLRVLTLQGD